MNVIEHGLFQAETDDKYYTIRIVADTSRWHFIPTTLLEQIQKVEAQLKEKGLAPAPFGYEMS